MMLSDLQSKDIINLVDGKRIGSIIDIKIGDNGEVAELSVQRKRFLFFSGGVITLKWTQIDKIGKDVILVNIVG